LFVAIQKGGRWAEIGPYYDFPNDPVTLHFLPGRDHGQSVTCEFGRVPATALLQPSAVGAIIPARHDPERWTFGFPEKRDQAGNHKRRRSMSSMSEEADPSESRAAARNAAAGPLPSRVTFNRFELNRILNLYGRMVADGEWRDYAIDFLRDRAVFSVFRRASEVPIYRIEKDPRLARKQGIYSVISASGLILRRGHELDRVLLVIDRKLVVV
jgi:hypothetical protein